MKLFLKVFKSLFKIVLSLTIAIVSFVVDILLSLEWKLERLNSKLYPPPSVSNKEYMKKVVKEYNERISKKEVVVD